MEDSGISNSCFAPVPKNSIPLLMTIFDDGPGLTLIFSIIDF